MKKLSYWARFNPWKARAIILISHLLILLIGWYTGMALNKMNVIIPAATLFVFITFYFISVFMYPSKDEKRKYRASRFYNRQKLCDLSLAASAWLMIICIANNKNLQTGFLNYATAASIETSIVKPKPEKQTAAEILESLKHRDKNSLTREEKRILKKEFKLQLKNYFTAKIKGNKKAEGDAGLIILSIVAALGLLYLVGALACSLSCNGSDAAAIIVALIGTAGIVIGLIFVIRSIKKKHRKEEQVKTTNS